MLSNKITKLNEIKTSLEMKYEIWKFEVKMDHPILVRRSDLVIVNGRKRTCLLEDFTIPADHTLKVKEKKKIEWISEPC